MHVAPKRLVPPDTLSISRKLLALVAVGLVGMVVVLVVFHRLFADSLYDERKRQSHALADAARSIVAHYHGLSSRGELSPPEAQRQALQALRSANYGQDGYFWVSSDQGQLLMHPQMPELEGSALLDRTDGQGELLLQQIARQATSGGGWVDYHWPKPGGSEPHRKLSYVTAFAPWGWVIGTGLYLDELASEINAKALRIGAVMLLCLLSMGLLAVLLSRRFMREIEQHAIRDPLTGLYTRLFLEEAIGDLVQYQRRTAGSVLSAILLDVDHFKRINDQCGHAKGDEVLRHIGQVIKAASRPNDLAIRYGGEEFLILSLSDDETSAIVLAERIREAVSQKGCCRQPQECVVTLSAGIAIFSGDEPFDETLLRADRNLYRAKQNGRDAIVF